LRRGASDRITPSIKNNPSGVWRKFDLETGRAHAREFFPLLQFNLGSAALGWIVSAKAIIGRKLPGHRGIDDVALGFMMQIGENLQAAIVQEIRDWQGVRAA
jgi:hypothetical protein